MKRLLSIMGGLSITALSATAVVSCADKTDYSFVLKQQTGLGIEFPVDKFDKRDVEYYYFGNYSKGELPGMTGSTEVFIKFKDKGLKIYGNLHGYIDFWLSQLVNGLGFAPNQEAGHKNEIPAWAWIDAGLSDWIEK